MTILSRPAGSSTAWQKKNYVPPSIGLDRPERKEYEKSKVLSLKLRSNPADENSQTYELTVPFFRSGTPEDWLLTKKDIG